MSHTASLDQLFAPTGVAIVGISRSEGSLGRRYLRNLRANGYAGEVYGVHPSAAEVDGLQCWRGLTDIRHPIDVAVVLRPPEETIAHVRDAGVAGVKWVLASGGGFENEPGLTAQLRSTAEQGGVRILGPNTEGYWDLASHTVLSFGSVASSPLRPGPAAVISQSGGVGAAMARALNAAGMGCELFVSTGNELDLGFQDVLRYTVGRHGLRLLVLYVEALADLGEVRDLVANASRSGALVAAMVVGRSDEGAAAAASHSGRMAGRYDLVTATIESAGGVIVDSLTEVSNLARGLRTGRPAVDKGLGVIAVSGGTRAITADAIGEARHLRLAEFSTGTVDRLTAILPDFAVTENPVDVTGAVVSDSSLLDASLKAVAADPDVGGILVQLGNTALEALPDWVTRGTTGTPVPVWITGLLHPELERQTETVASLPEPRLAVKAIDALAVPPPPLPDRSIRPGTVERVDRPRTFIEGALILRRLGVETPATTPLHEGNVVLPTVPAIVKTANLAIHHKVQQGGIAFGVVDSVSAIAAASEIRRRLGDQAEPVVVQAVVEHGVELLVAVHRTASGSYAVVGAGGTATEDLHDVAVCLLPCSVEELRLAIGRTRIAARLGPDEFSGVATTVRALATMLEAIGCEELEINPLVVIGQTPTALDLLVR